MSSHIKLSITWTEVKEDFKVCTLTPLYGPIIGSGWCILSTHWNSFSHWGKKFTFWFTQPKLLESFKGYLIRSSVGLSLQSLVASGHYSIQTQNRKKRKSDTGTCSRNWRETRSRQSTIFPPLYVWSILKVLLVCDIRLILRTVSRTVYHLRVTPDTYGPTPGSPYFHLLLSGTGVHRISDHWTQIFLSRTRI